MIQERILELTEYGLVTGLVEPQDKRFTINRLLELFHIDELEDEVTAAYEKRTPMTQESAEEALPQILAEMLDYAAEQMLIPDNTITYRDLFDTKIMSMLVPRPSEVVRRFYDLYEKESPQAATDYFYKLSRDTDYIRRYRVKKDLKWTADTEFGTLDITINLSKPEKDPKAIAAAKLAKRAAIRNAFCARKTRDTQDASPSGETEPPHHSGDHQPERLVFPVFSVRLLQRALHCVQRKPHTDEDRARYLRKAA